MPAAFTHIINNFITLFVVVDPVGLVLPTFLALTSGLTPSFKRKLAVQSVVVSFVVMLFFIALAQIIIEAIGLSLRSFQIAGGIILLLFAISLVLGSGQATAADASGRPTMAAWRSIRSRSPPSRGPARC